MRKALAILFLTIFTIQILPIRAIGKMLWNSQMTEEVHEHGPCHKKMTNDNHDKFWYLHFITPPGAEQETRTCFKHAFRDETLFKCPHLEVPLQPPNIA